MRIRLSVSAAWAAAVFMLGMGCSAATGPGSGASGGPKVKASGPLTLAVVPKAVGFDFWDSVRKGAQCAASKMTDVKVQWDGVTAETDVTGQVNLLQNFLTRQVNGLVYAATDAKVLAQVTQDALSRNVPVINIDSGTNPQPANVPVFATDNVAAARKAADLLADALGPGVHKIAFIPFQPGTLTNDQRTKGFKEGLAKHPNLMLVAEQSSNSDPNTALSVTENILTANPDLDGIFAANEPGVVGATNALTQAGKAGKIKLIGWDASPDEVNGVTSGSITALVVQNPFRMGFDSVIAMTEHIRKGISVSNEDTGVYVVTKQNMNQTQYKAILAPSCT
ncbi:MAG TPA: ABC transporter substrate-binding protein, partial [Pseudonocardiaceae bacterium]|nr:ABC transporter substrate-binding protein [Pseudonocardiaceae bacterium]